MLSSLLRRPLQLNWRTFMAVGVALGSWNSDSTLMHQEQRWQSKLGDHCLSDVKLVHFTWTHPPRPHHTPAVFHLLLEHIAQAMGSSRGPGLGSILARMSSIWSAYVCSPGATLGIRYPGPIWSQPKNPLCLLVVLMDFGSQLLVGRLVVLLRRSIHPWEPFYENQFYVCTFAWTVLTPCQNWFWYLDCLCF